MSETPAIRPINPGDLPEHAPLGTPGDLDVELRCPSCQAPAMVTAHFQTRLIRDQDGKANALALRTRAAKATHTCGQMALGLAEGARER